MKQKYQILFFAFALILARVFGGKIKGDTMVLVSSLIPSSLGRAFMFYTALGGVKYLVIASNAVVAAHESGHIALHREGVNQNARSLGCEVFCDLHAVKCAGQVAVLHMLNKLIVEQRNKADGVRKLSTFFGTGNFGKRYQEIMEGYVSVFNRSVDELMQRRLYIIALTIKGDEVISGHFNGYFPKRVLRHLV